MYEKIMNVFYGTDLLPYKDKERQVHYPITGNAFLGASNTTQIRFFIDQIGDYNDTWVANSKLPNGKLGNRVLSSGFDWEFGEHYVYLDLSSYYTQAKGDLYISLNGFYGSVTITEDNGQYSISGIPTIQATGVIKIAINYATPLISGDEVDIITLQQLLAVIMQKSDNKYLKVVDSIVNINTETYKDYLSAGDVVWAKGQDQLYLIGGTYPSLTYTSITLDLDNLNTTNLQVSGNLTIQDFNNIKNGSNVSLPTWLSSNYVDKTNVANRVYGTDNSGNETTIPVDSFYEGTIVRRDSDNSITVPLVPTQNGYATSKKYVDDLITTVKANAFKVVSSLPAVGEEGIIYLIETSSGSGVYDQYIWEGNAYVYLGRTQIDLSNYYTKSQTDTLLNAKANSSDVYTQNQVNALLEDKANVDGNYPTMTVGVADELSPYDEESGDDQDTPFNFQATGTANGTQPDFSTGGYALLKEKQGHTIVKNQLVVNGDFESNTGWVAHNTSYATYSYDSTNKEGTITITNNNATYLFEYGLRTSSGMYPSIVGHKYLILINIKSNTLTRFGVDSYGGSVELAKNGNLYYTIWNCSAVRNNFLFIKPWIVVPNVGDKYTVSFAYCIDLTQWFNGNIPQDLLDHPLNFFRYYQGDLSYNTGTIIHGNAQYIKCIGRQQWDEEWELGVYNDGNGQPSSNNNRIRSKSTNPIKVVPNTQYNLQWGNGYFNVLWYDKDDNFISHIAKELTESHVVTSPSNACYMRFYIGTASNTTYNNNITVSLYYSGESGYDQYYPYEVLSNTDTGSEIIYAFDTKEPNGTIHRITDSVNLGSLGWTRLQNSQGNYIFAAELSYATNEAYSFGICANYVISSTTGGYDVLPDKQFVGRANGTMIYFRDDSYSSSDSFKTAMNGVYLFYKKLNPTTEQGTPFSENIFIDDFGTMSFEGASGVPQGNLIFYPVDYKAYIDTVYKRSEGTPNNIFTKNSDFVKVAELSAQSTYAGGNVAIANVSNYSFFLICFDSNCADRPRGATIVPNVSGVPHEIYHNFQFNDGSNDVGVSACRRVTITGTGMTFGAGFVVSDTSGAVGASSMCIPLTIYGIKL